MKKTLLVILSPVVLLVMLLIFMPQHFAHPSPSEAKYTPRTSENELTGDFTATAPTKITDSQSRNGAADDQDIIAYALTLMGTPYVWAGESPDGFDCSGFITHVYDRYDVSLPHSSRMQAEEGEQVQRQEARPGDLVIFTGTNSQVREPGHVGIVISQPGDTIEFVHSSSNGGVKISQVEGTGYDRRFLEVRRVL